MFLQTYGLSILQKNTNKYVCVDQDNKPKKIYVLKKVLGMPSFTNVNS